MILAWLKAAHTRGAGMARGGERRMMGTGMAGQGSRTGQGGAGGGGGSSGAPGSSSGNAYIRRGERLTYMCSCAAGPPGIARRVMTIEVGAHLV